MWQLVVVAWGVMASTGRSVLVTGASSGIGLATAHQLLDCGWRVFAAARRQEGMDALKRLGADVLPLELADAGSRQQLADAIHDEVGALHAVVNNAGFGDLGPVEPWASIARGPCLR